MLMSVPFNKYDDETGKIANDLFYLNTKFHETLSFLDLTEITKRALTDYEELIKIQISLNKEKTSLDAQEFKEYQTKLDSAFKYFHLVEKKLTNARNIFIDYVRNDQTVSVEDEILFSNDDLLL